MTLSQQLVARWKALPPGGIPHAVRQAAKLHLLDAIGVGLAAAATSAGQPYLAALSALNGSGGAASVFGARDGFAAATAALANGGMIHALEYDDTHIASIVHGSSVLAAAAFAAAEAAEASGDDLLTAYIKGWEVLPRKAVTRRWASRSFSLNPVSTPIRRIRSACCARAASDHAAAPPRSVVNARRFIDPIVSAATGATA